MPVRLPAIILLLSTLIMSGCMTAHVSTSSFKGAPDLSAISNPKKLDGIPFYAQKGVCKRESIWLETKYILTLNEKIDGGDPVTDTRTLSFDDFQHAPATQLLQELHAMAGRVLQEDSVDVKNQVEHITTLWNSVPQSPRPVPEDRLNGNPNVLLTQNTAKISTQVDYSHVLFLNSVRPLTGTSQVDAKLNADGTLSEGTAQTDDETISSILSAAGTAAAGYFTGGTASTAAAAATPALRTAAPAHTVVYSYSVTTKSFLHDHKRTDSLSDGSCAAGDPVLDGNFILSEVGASSGKNDSKNAITVSGQVQLPNAQSGKPN
jgi:hypothetical protein